MYFIKLHTVEPPGVSGHPYGSRKNVVLVCSWEYDQVSAYERCPPNGGAVSGGSTVLLWCGALKELSFEEKLLFYVK